MSRYRFTRYVNFAEMAEGVVVEVDNLKKAIRKAVLLCNEPNTVLVLDADRIEELEADRDLRFSIECELRHKLGELQSRIEAGRNWMDGWAGELESLPPRAVDELREALGGKHE